METKTMEEDEEPIQIYPAWRQAISVLKQEGLKEGDVISHEWLYRNFGIQIPKPDKVMTRKEHEKLDFEFLGQFTPFKEKLLKEDQVALRNIPERGYEIVPAAAQTQWAWEEGIIDVRRGVRKMTNRLANVNMTRLTAEERRENADTLAKAHMLETMTRPRRLEKEYRNKLIEGGK